MIVCLISPIRWVGRMWHRLCLDGCNGDSVTGQFLGRGFVGNTSLGKRIGSGVPIPFNLFSNLKDHCHAAHYRLLELPLVSQHGNVVMRYRHVHGLKGRHTDHHHGHLLLCPMTFPWGGAFPLRTFLRPAIQSLRQGVMVEMRITIAPWIPVL